MNESRSYVGPLELRFDASTRTLTGRAMPFGETVRIGGPMGFDERFARGAFTRTIAERVDKGKVKLFGQHGRTQGHMPIGQVVSAREEPSGLYITAQIADTTAGRDAVELIRSGVAEGLSVSFGTKADREVDGVREVTEAVLFEVSVVDEPAYPSAQVLSLRSRLDELQQLAGVPLGLPGGPPSLKRRVRELELFDLEMNQ
jgi:HK97 family phage prohead protease